MSEFLLELYSEEVPPQLQINARNELKQILEKLIEEEGLKYKSLQVYSTPTRLTLFNQDLSEKISKDVENEQISRLNDIKKARDNKLVKLKLKNIEKACKTNENLVPIIIDAVLEYATLGEIVESMKNVFGEWTEKSII